jgi:hypothetical protein
MQSNESENRHPVITPVDPVTHPDVRDRSNPCEPEGAPSPGPVTQPQGTDETTSREEIKQLND